MTAWPKGQGPGALRWAGPGRAREGRGPTSQAAVSPMAAPALFPASTNTRQTKSLFLPILNPVPLPSPPSAKVKTRNWKPGVWSGCRGGSASKGNKTSHFLQGPNQAKAQVGQASGIPYKCCVTLWPCDRRLRCRPSLGSSAPWLGRPRLPEQSLPAEAAGRAMRTEGGAVPSCLPGDHEGSTDLILPGFGVQSPPGLGYFDPHHSQTPAQGPPVIQLANKGTSFLLPKPKITLEET